MTAAAPTIAELRARVHKDRHREIGNWLARRVARPTAVYGSDRMITTCAGWIVSTRTPLGRVA